MSVSAVSAAASAPQYASKIASDGDSAAIEAQESNATAKSERLNGGVEPKAAPAAAAARPGATGVNTIA